MATLTAASGYAGLYLSGWQNPTNRTATSFVVPVVSPGSPFTKIDVQIVANTQPPNTQTITAMSFRDDNGTVHLTITGLSHDEDSVWNFVEVGDEAGLLGFLLQGPDLVNLSPQADSIVTQDGNDTVYGGNGNDIVSGGGSGDLIYGGAGDDSLYGGTGGNPGDDNVYGDAGNDRFFGSTGRDTAYGGDGVDTLEGNGDTDTLYGDADADVVSGGSAGDLAYGGLGNDTLYGGDDTDTLYGGEGNDTLYGDAGADVLSGGAGADTLQGAMGVDRADYSLLTNALNIQLNTELADAGAEGGFDRLYGIENAVAGTGDDQIWGNDVANVLQGGFGNDWLHGFGADDTLYGGGGSDRLVGGAGADTLYGDAGGNDMFWFDFQDVMFGGSATDYAFNTDTAGVNVDLAAASLEGVWANDGADLLDASGTSWSVQLIGFGSGDTLRGGSGNDYLWFDELDTVTGGGGIDAAYATTGNGVTVNYATQGIEQVWATNGNDRLDASGLAIDGVYLIGYAGTDAVLGGSGNDYMWLDWDATDTVLGGSGRDEMYHIGSGALDLDLAAMQVEGVLGGALADRIDGSGQTQAVLAIGLGGDDTLTGSAQSSDALYGGSGNDTLRGGAGTDFLFGGSGNDTFVFSSVSGGSGTDYILDFASGDKVLAGSNTVVSGMGSSTVVLADNSTLIAFNAHNWAAGDFT